MTVQPWPGTELSAQSIVVLHHSAHVFKSASFCAGGMADHWLLLCIYIIVLNIHFIRYHYKVLTSVRRANTPEAIFMCHLLVIHLGLLLSANNATVRRHQF